MINRVAKIRDFVRAGYPSGYPENRPFCGAGSAERHRFGTRKRYFASR